MSPRLPVSTLLVLITLPAVAVSEMGGAASSVKARAEFVAGAGAQVRPAAVSTATVYVNDLPPEQVETFALSNSERIELREQITAAAAEIYASENQRGGSKAQPNP